MSAPPGPGSRAGRKLELVRVREGKRSVHWPAVGVLVLIAFLPGLAIRWIFDVYVWPETASRSWPARIAWSAFLALAVALAITRMHWDRRGAMLQRPKRRS